MRPHVAFLTKLTTCDGSAGTRFVGKLWLKARQLLPNIYHLVELARFTLASFGIGWPVRNHCAPLAATRDPREPGRMGFYEENMFLYCGLLQESAFILR